MKDLKEVLYGKEYADKLKLMEIKFEQIKADYVGDYDVENGRMVTMAYDGIMIPVMSMDENVPNDLRQQLIEGFNSIWS